MSLKQFPVTVVWNHSISWISCDINNFCFLGFSLFWKHFIWKVGLDQSWFILWKVFYKIDWVIWWWLWQQFFLRKLFINLSMHEKMSNSTPLIGICHKYKYFQWWNYYMCTYPEMKIEFLKNNRNKKNILKTWFLATHSRLLFYVQVSAWYYLERKVKLMAHRTYTVLVLFSFSSKILYKRIGRDDWFLSNQSEYSLFAAFILLWQWNNCVWQASSLHSHWLVQKFRLFISLFGFCGFSLRIYVSISWPDCQKVFSYPRMDSCY